MTSNGTATTQEGRDIRSSERGPIGKKEREPPSGAHILGGLINPSDDSKIATFWGRCRSRCKRARVWILDTLERSNPVGSRRGSDPSWGSSTCQCIPSDQAIESRGVGGGVARNAESDRLRAGGDIAEGQRERRSTKMKELRPGHYVSIPFQSPRTEAEVEVTIDADGPVDVDAMPEDALDDYLDEDVDEYVSYERQEDVIQTSFLFTPERRKRWVLLIENPGDDPVHVSYDVRW